VFVETGISLVVLLLAVFSVIDAAALIWTYLSLENAVSEATRFAVTQQTLANPSNPASQLSRIESIKLKARMEADGIQIDDGEFSFQDLTTGLAGAGGPNDVIQVTINHPYQLLLPLPVPNPATLNQFPIAVSSTMLNEPPPP
jgi:hypothetical protein